MKKYKFTLIFTCLYVAIQICIPLFLNAQQTADVDPELEGVKLNRAPVIVDGKTLFKVRGVLSHPAELRAASIAKRIQEAASNPSVSADSVKITEEPERLKIFAGDLFIINIYPEDGIAEGISSKILAEVMQAKIKQAIEDHREARSRPVLIRKMINAALSLVIFIVFMFVLLWLFRKTRIGLQNRIRRRIESVENKSFNLSFWEALFRVSVSREVFVSARRRDTDANSCSDDSRADRNVASSAVRDAIACSFSSTCDRAVLRRASSSMISFFFPPRAAFVSDSTRDTDISSCSADSRADRNVVRSLLRVFISCSFSSSREVAIPKRASRSCRSFSFASKAAFVSERTRDTDANSCSDDSRADRIVPISAVRDVIACSFSSTCDRAVLRRASSSRMSFSFASKTAFVSERTRDTDASSCSDDSRADRIVPISAVRDVIACSFSSTCDGPY